MDVRIPRPLDDIEFLARSENRVTVLETLSAHPQARADLEASTGISKVTVGRILEDFLERGWIRREGEEYRTTTTGDALVTDFSRRYTTVGTAQRLGDVVPYLHDVRFLTRMATPVVLEGLHEEGIDGNQTVEAVPPTVWSSGFDTGRAGPIATAGRYPTRRTAEVTDHHESRLGVLRSAGDPWIMLTHYRT